MDIGWQSKDYRSIEDWDAFAPWTPLPDLQISMRFNNNRNYLTGFISHSNEALGIDSSGRGFLFPRDGTQDPSLQ